MTHQLQYKQGSTYQTKFSPRNRNQLEQQRRLRLSPTNSKSIPSFSPGHWKNYLVNDLLVDQNSSKIPSIVRPPSPSYGQDANPIHDKREEQLKRKSQIMRRVRQLQQKVLPMIENDHQQKIREQEDFGWQGRIQQKLLKLETAVDSLRKDVEIQTQRKIMELQNKWQIKFQQLLSRMNQ